MEKDGLGPGTYNIKAANTTPVFSFGSRFDTDIRSKNHIKPKKVDGPDPGSYTMASSFNVYQPKAEDKDNKKTSWGKSTKDWSNLPKAGPGPNKYNPDKHTEASHSYSFPKATRTDKVSLKKAMETPGPNVYVVRRNDKQEGTAKSFLGGALGQKPIFNNGVPGP